MTKITRVHAHQGRVSRAIRRLRALFAVTPFAAALAMVPLTSGARERSATVHHHATGTYVLSVPTDGTPVNVAVQQWAASISGDCSNNVSGVIMPGTYVLNREVIITNPDSACSPTRQISITANVPHADTLIQTGVWAHDSSGHYDNAVGVFHVSTPNVSISGHVIESNGQLPDPANYGGAAVRFWGDSGSHGSVINNHIFGMQSAGVDTYGAEFITVDGNVISCSALGSGAVSSTSMGVNVRGAGISDNERRITVNNNTISDCADEGILAEGTSLVHITNNTVNCYVADCGYGISLQGIFQPGNGGTCTIYPTDNSYVGYNTINGAHIRNPILLWGSGPTRGDTIEENNVNGATKSNDPNVPDGRGIALSASFAAGPCSSGGPEPTPRYSAVVHNNRVQQTPGYGIYIGGSFTQAYGNYVDHTDNGLVVEEGAIFADVRSGRYTYNNNGLVVRAPGATVYGNGMYHNKDIGMCITNQAYTPYWNDYAYNGRDLYVYGSPSPAC